MSSTSSSTVLSRLSGPVLSGGLLLAYDAFTQGLSQSAWFDAAYLAGANLASNVLTQTFFNAGSIGTNLFGTNATMIENNIVSPVLCALIYNYLYESMYKQQFNLSSNRTQNMNYVISFIISAVSIIYSGSIYALLTLNTTI